MDNVIAFPAARCRRPIPPDAIAPAGVQGADPCAGPFDGGLVPSALGAVEVAVLTFLAELMADRPRLLALMGRYGFHQAALGLDQPLLRAGLGHAMRGLAMLFGAEFADGRPDAREKIAVFVDLPDDGTTHLALALAAFVEADRRALGMRRGDLA